MSRAAGSRRTPAIRACGAACGTWPTDGSSCYESRSARRAEPHLRACGSRPTSDGVTHYLCELWVIRALTVSRTDVLPLFDPDDLPGTLRCLHRGGLPTGLPGRVDQVAVE